ncbi:MAG: flavin reductase family protein [Defluviitaleaceae bacterium]|nr:flavin reductase family protein [Defluviitaleaceae bacterium]
MQKTRLENPFHPVYPAPIGLVVSIDENKKPNVMTASDIVNINLRNPAIIGISIARAAHTHSLITKSGQFTINFPTSAILEKVDLVGSCSGRKVADKFEKYGLTPAKSSEIDAPIIEECPVNLECKVISTADAGKHTLFIAEVAAMHVHSDKLGENEEMLIEKMDGILFAEWQYFKIGEKLGDMYFAIGGKRPR